MDAIVPRSFRGTYVVVFVLFLFMNEGKVHTRKHTKGKQEISMSDCQTSESNKQTKIHTKGNTYTITTATRTTEDTEKNSGSQKATGKGWVEQQKRVISGLEQTEQQTQTQTR